MSMASDALDTQMQKQTALLVDDLSAKASSPGGLAKAFGLADAGSDLADRELLQVKIAFKQLGLAASGSMLTPTDEALREMTGMNVPSHAIVVEREAEGAISALFRKLPKLAGIHFAKDGAVEAVEPSSIQSSVFMFSDGSVITRQREISGNSVAITAEIAKLATSTMQLAPADAGKEAELMEALKGACDEMGKDLTTQKAKDAVAELSDQFLLDLATAALKHRSGSPAFASATMEAYLAETIDLLADPATGGWIKEVAKITCDGHVVKSPKALRAALGAPALLHISLEEALARRRGASDSAAQAAAPSNKARR